MFDHIRSRNTVEPQRLGGHAADLQAILQDAGAKAGMSASQLADVARSRATYAREWATPHVGAGVEWVRPKVGSGVEWARPHATRVWEGGRTKAVPHVERAAGAAVPLVDSAHDRIVDDLIPKLVTAVNTATVAATTAVNAAALATTAGANRAHDVTSTRLNKIARLSQPEKSHRVVKVLWVLTAVAAIGAAVAAWRRSGPTTDPWAEEPWEASDSERADRTAEAREEFQGVVDDVRHELGDRAESLGEAAGGAVARAREATERAREATERAAERARANRKPSRRRAADSDSDATGETTSTGGTSAGGSDDEGTAGAPPADHQLGTTPSEDVATPADIADSIGSQLEGTQLDSDDSDESTKIEDEDNRSV